MAILLGVDYGEKRIGIARGDDETRIAMPMTTVAGRMDVTRDARQVADLAAEHDAAAIVVGLPLNMDGTEGPQSELTRRFVQALERLSGLPVHLRDERLTSFAAEEVLADSELGRKKRKELLDQIAAQKILQAYLDASEGDGSNG